MKQICCECKVQYGTKPGPEDAETHGYCPPCFVLEMEKINTFAAGECRTATPQSGGCFAAPAAVTLKEAA